MLTGLNWIVPDMIGFRPKFNTKPSIGVSPKVDTYHICTFVNGQPHCIVRKEKTPAKYAIMSINFDKEETGTITLLPDNNYDYDAKLRIFLGAFKDLLSLFLLSHY